MIRGVLLDLGGVVYSGDCLLPGALDALDRLRTANLPVRYLTNTTRKPKRRLVAQLASLGVHVRSEQMFMPAQAACQWLMERRMTAELLVHPDLEEDFAGLPSRSTGGRALVVGDAGEAFDYAALNRAFRCLIDGAEFLALARNRSFQDVDGKLSLDAGPFVAALEFACARKATVVGKPSAAFFDAAVATLGVPRQNVVMIGDDAEADVGGAKAAGLKGLLVRSGKYQQGDEKRLDEPPDALLDDLPAAVDWVLTHRVQ